MMAFTFPLQTLKQEPDGINILLREGIRPPRSLGGGNKLYKSLGSGLRDTMQVYLDAGGDEAAQSRKHGFLWTSLEEGPMRAAFTLRKTKKHEKEVLVLGHNAVHHKKIARGTTWCQHFTVFYNSRPWY
jgi:hypothetical protein